MRRISKNTGYSGTPLIKKLGIKENSTVIFMHPPTDYSRIIGELPKNALSKNKLSGSFDFIQIFARNAKELESDFPNLKQHLKPDGSLWVSWPKKASGITTDLDENKIRKIGLENGLVDIKVCAVDEKWSGLKFVYRLADRQKK